MLYDLYRELFGQVDRYQLVIFMQIAHDLRTRIGQEIAKSIRRILKIPPRRMGVFIHRLRDDRPSALGRIVFGQQILDCLRTISSFASRSNLSENAQRNGRRDNG